MDNVPREKLREIIDTYKLPICDDPRRCRGLLSDMCGEYKRENRVLITALEERVAAELLNSATGISYEVTSARLIKRLYDHHGIAEEFAAWAVDSWALALGVITVDESKALSRVANSRSSTIQMPNMPTLVVAQQGERDYATFGEALKSARLGSRIVVHPGVYAECIVLDRPVEIVGEGPRNQVIIESRDGSCIMMQTDTAIVRGVTLRVRSTMNNRMYCAVDVPQGQLVLEDCDITSDSFPCVTIRGPMAYPLIRKCSIHDGNQCGILVTDRGQGRIEYCDVFGNGYAGIEIVRGGNPLIWGCKIHHGHTSGILVAEQGQGRIDNCDIYENAYAGIGIRVGGNPLIRGCRINRNQYQAVWVYDRGRGTVIHSDLTANIGGPLKVDDHCLVHCAENIQ